MGTLFRTGRGSVAFLMNGECGFRTRTSRSRAGTPSLFHTAVACWNCPLDISHLGDSGTRMQTAAYRIASDA